MHERLAIHSYYYFLHGFLGYFHIQIVYEDQHKPTFMCPHGTFIYRRMPFGLCSAPTTFQRCVTSIFNEMMGDSMEVFMEDFSDNFGLSLKNLELSVKCCVRANLVLNWKKLSLYGKRMNSSRL